MGRVGEDGKGGGGWEGWGRMGGVGEDGRGGRGLDIRCCTMQMRKCRIFKFVKYTVRKFN